MLWCRRSNLENGKRILSSKLDLVSAHSWHLVKRLARDYVRPQRWRILGALLFMAVFSACTSGLAFLMKPIVNIAFGGSDVSMLYEAARRSALRRAGLNEPPAILRNLAEPAT